MKTPKHNPHPGGFSWGMVIALIIVVALAGLVTLPIQPRCGRRSEQTEAVNNARQIGLAMLDFEIEYGRFPDKTTEPKVIATTGSKLRMTGHTANDYFRQLIAADIAQSEIMFFAKTAFSNRKPDERFDTTEDALKPGDVGFGYLMNGDTAFDNKESPGRVLVCAPLAVEDGHVSTLRFDRDMYDQKAVVLKMDNSVISLNVNQAGDAILGSKPLLATGEGTVWGVDATPTVVPPAPGEIRFASSVTKNSGPMIWLVSAALLIVFLLLIKLARPTARPVERDR